MAKTLVSDELWQLIHPLLPPDVPKPKGGRPRVPDRAALEGILYVLKLGSAGNTSHTSSGTAAA